MWLPDVSGFNFAKPKDKTMQIYLSLPMRSSFSNVFLPSVVSHLWQFYHTSHGFSIVVFLPQKKTQNLPTSSFFPAKTCKMCPQKGGRNFHETFPTSTWHAPGPSLWRKLPSWTPGTWSLVKMWLRSRPGFGGKGGEDLKGLRIVSTWLYTRCSGHFVVRCWRISLQKIEFFG